MKYETYSFSDVAEQFEDEDGATYEGSLLDLGTLLGTVGADVKSLTVSLELFKHWLGSYYRDGMRGVYLDDLCLEVK